MDEKHALALKLAEGQKPSPKTIERVSSQVGPDLARWAFTQWELRQNGVSKFERATEMLYTREALEQATRSEIAAYHASRFPAGEPVTDLTCGIGADLLALAARGPAVGYDIDAERVEYARHNLQVHGLTAEVRNLDCFEAEWGNYAFADPARRVAGVRKLDPAQFTPDPASIANQMASLKLGGIKLTPLLQDSYLEGLGPELAFVAAGDECPEVVVWCGAEAQPGRYAIFADTGERLHAEAYAPGTGDPGEMLYEAHPAAIRSHGLGTLCEQFSLCALGDSNGYLTGPPVESRWLKSYRVLAAIKGDLRAVKMELKQLGSRTPVIKSRAGVDVDYLRKDLKLEGERTLILAVYAIGKSLRYAILAEA